MEIKKIGVVGAGTMGSGIAQMAAESGYQVIIRDIEEALVQKGINNMEKSLKKAVEKGKKKQEETESTLNRIEGATDLQRMEEADYIIEAVLENMETKKAFGPVI